MLLRILILDCLNPGIRQKKFRWRYQDIELNMKEKCIYGLAHFLIQISECDRTVIEPFLFDWMIKKEDIKKWIKYPNDERKLMQVIDEIILDSRRKTNELDLCWGVISCRK